MNLRVVYVHYGQFASFMKDELKKKAFDFASETTKQLITLSTALIALSITFKGNFSNTENQSLLLYCWISFFISVLFGIGTLMALTGTLEKCTEESDNPVALSIYGANVKRPSFLQILFFLIGLLFLGIYGGKSINNDDKVESSEQIKVVKETTYKFLEPNKTDTLDITKSR
jgi:hypothetical protein